MAKSPPKYSNDLPTFLGDLRSLVFTSQDKAARHFRVSRPTITRYENGMHAPPLGYLACLTQLVVERQEETLAPIYREELLGEVNRAICKHYYDLPVQSWEALWKVAETYLAQQYGKRGPKIYSKPAELDQVNTSWHAQFNKLDIPNNTLLIGVNEKLQILLNILFPDKPPWIISIEGIGGLGKTALAGASIQKPGLSACFHNFAWISAKRQLFSFEKGLEDLHEPVLHPPELIDKLLEQLDGSIPLSQPSRQKLITLTKLLKEKPYLIVVDNLESMVDYQTLLPLLRTLANPSKFLLTSRHSLVAYPEVFCLTLDELNQTNTARFLRQEIDLRGLSAKIEAADTHFGDIYQVVGGNPLALKLIVGQLTVLSLSQVLENLKQVRGRKIDDLYTFIYWQAWRLLNAACRKVLLMMPLVQDGTTDQLMELTKLGIEELGEALESLTELSLIQVGGKLEERQYTIHRLTETFLLKEAIRWQN